MITKRSVINGLIVLVLITAMGYTVKDLVFYPLAVLLNFVLAMVQK